MLISFFSFLHLMSNWSQAMDLPSEILFKVFKEISVEQQAVLQTVCKSWYYPARQIYFANVHLKDKCNVSQLIHGLQSAGSLVKSLKVDQHTGLDQQDMINLISACPQLRELYIYNLPIYFEWLFKQHVPLPHLKRLALMGRVSWRSNETNGYYYRVAHQYKDQLEKLEVILTCSPVFQQEFGGIMHFLGSFKNLKDLTLLNGSRNVCVYFDQLMGNCPSLERLRIDLGHPLVNPETELSCQLYPAMRSIDIFLTRFSFMYFRYMMQRFVNLTEMHVRINQNKLDWIADKKDIVSFMQYEYIPFIKQLSCSSLVIKMQDASCIGDAMADFTRISTDSTIDAIFEVYDGRHQRTEISLHTRKHHTVAHYLFIRDFSSGSIELPFLKHLATYGHHVKKLKIDMSNVESRSIDLGLILKDCGNTRELELDLAPMWGRDCSWTDRMQIIQTNEPNVKFSDTRAMNDGLLKLRLNGAMITSDLMNKMAKQTPNLHSLSLFNCTFFIQESNTTKFDMSNLNLKILTMDVKSFYHLDHTCFMISSAGGKKCDYFLLNVKLDTFEKVEKSDRNVHVEFQVNSIQSFQVHVGKFSKQQRIQEF